MIAAVPLSGCLYAAIPSDVPAVEDPISTPEPTTGDENTADGDSTTSTSLSFEDGALLPADTYIEWGDGLMADDGWELSTPDTGTGTWGYTTVDDSCTATFWQGNMDGLTLAGDDAIDSDAVIAYFLNASVADVTAAATDTELSYQIGGAGGLEARTVAGQQDGRSWNVLARAFSGMGGAVYLVVDCAGSSTEPVLSEVIDKNAVLAY